MRLPSSRRGTARAASTRLALFSCAGLLPIVAAGQPQDIFNPEARTSTPLPPSLPPPPSASPSPAVVQAPPTLSAVALLARASKPAPPPVSPSPPPLQPVLVGTDGQQCVLALTEDRCKILHDNDPLAAGGLSVHVVANVSLPEGCSYVQTIGATTTHTYYYSYAFGSSRSGYLSPPFFVLCGVPESPSPPPGVPHGCEEWDTEGFGALTLLNDYGGNLDRCGRLNNAAGVYDTAYADVQAAMKVACSGVFDICNAACTQYYERHVLPSGTFLRKCVSATNGDECGQSTHEIEDRAGMCPTSSPPSSQPPPSPPPAPPASPTSPRGHVGKLRRLAAEPSTTAACNDVKIAAADYHTCAILLTGDLKCFGKGELGRLGSDSEDNIGDEAGATSCASIYIAQLLDVLVPASVTILPAARVAAVRAGPLVTIAGEMSIALLLLAPASSASARLRPLRKLGVGLALLLHLGIALTPPPNNIAEYGVMCALRLAWLLPHGVGAALADSPGWLALHVGNGALLVALLAARGPLFVGGGLDGWRAHLAAADGPLGTALGALDLPAFVYGCVCSLLLRALALDAQAQPPTPPTPPKPQPPPGSQPSSPPKGARSKSPPRSPPKAPPPTSPPKSSQKKKTTTSAAAAAAAAPASGGGREAAVRGLLLGWAAWYSFGSVIAGTLDISSPNMFSNVRMQGGSNHLLLPTSLLQKWHRHAGAASAFSGGVVRVESTNSTLFLSLHPGEFTPVLRPAAIGYLVDAGHSGRQWNSAVGQVVGSFVMPPNPAAAEGGEFVRYTLPAFAIRDLVRRARAAGEAFALTYAQLDGAGGDEEWRRESRGRRVTLQEDGEGGRSCVVELPDGTDTGPATEPCAADELVLQGPPSAWDPLNWLGSGQSWNSYVVDAPRGGQLHCYGS